MDIYQLDKKAKRLAGEFKKLEHELLEVIIEMDLRKGFYELGYNSLFSYVQQGLELSPALTAQFIKVARKSQEVPELKAAVASGRLSVSKAQKITSVLDNKNQVHWLSLAQKVTHCQLEREVAIASPNLAVVERAKYISPNTPPHEQVKVKREIPRIELQLGVSEKLMIQLRRIQDLESQKQKRNMNLEETLERLIESYLERQDPMRRAQRQQARGKLTMHENKIAKKNSSRVKWIEQRRQRKPLARKLYHQVMLRDGGQCTYKDLRGNRCHQKRFIEIHHIKPLAKGGDDHLENLRLLCHGHHKIQHLHN